MMALYGLLGLVWIITLIKRQWKVAGVLFIIILVFTPFATKSQMKESAKNYEQAMEAMQNKDYDKAEDLFKKVKKGYPEYYNPAQEELKKISDNKLVEKYVSSAETKFNNSDYEGAKSDLAQALNISTDYQKANDLLNKVNEAIQNKGEETKQKDDSKWTKDNIVSLLQKNKVLDKGMSFSDKLDGSKIYQQDSSFYGKTNIQNAYCLQLTINLNEKQVLDKEVLKKTAFNIAKVINDNSTKFDFNINLVRITFGNFDKNQYGDNMNNFSIGINTIKNYFSEPRSTSVGVSGATGEVKQIDFDKESFYKWIEDNFTLPEDNSVLAENNSWTTLSSKGNVK